ncbi:MAG: hypothetical protein ABS46_01580 [Cytophagaceae bacterium SCN 52-12]|nr:MAG: hypothetical protein ABS46_01580 [Cytophagaceae bacterium SCN 52-12]
MKNLAKILLLPLMLLTACEKDRPGKLETADIIVNVVFPATYSQQGAAGATVTLTNASDASVKTATTNSEGNAVFQEVLPGTYTFSASKNLTAAEAESLTGINTPVSLNATQGSVTISAANNPTFTLRLQGSAAGSLLIKEVYYTGSKTPSGGNYFSDQFVEIYNNSTDTLYLDSLCIADAYGNSGLINPTSLPTPYKEDQDHVYVGNVWRIPGSGKDHPLAPGQSILIAQDGVNHKEEELNPNSPVDLSAAEWETYNERPDNRDADAPGVPNLERLYFTGGFDWLLTVFGPGVIIFKADFNSLEQVPIPGSPLDPRIKVPNSVVIDAFEALKDGNSADFKRIPAGLEAGFVFADDTYTMQSFRRKVATVINGRRVLQDTNNSASDFEKLSAPTPKGF